MSIYDKGESYFSSSVGKFNEIKTIITSLSSRVVSVEKKHNKLSGENYNWLLELS
jgi:hypothetical protein